MPQLSAPKFPVLPLPCLHTYPYLSPYRVPNSTKTFETEALDIFCFFLQIFSSSFVGDRADACICSLIYGKWLCRELRGHLRYLDCAGSVREVHEQDGKDPDGWLCCQ
jgi:hypothetical protein